MPTDHIAQTMQWITVGGLPVAFLLGFLLVHRKRASLFVIMDKLYGECEMQKQLLELKGVQVCLCVVMRQRCAYGRISPVLMLMDKLCGECEMEKQLLELIN